MGDCVEILNEQYLEQPKQGDAGIDLIARDDPEFITDKDGDVLFLEYNTGVRIAPSSNSMHGLVFPRSSISKYHLSLCNSVAVIDSSYRGEIKLRFRRLKEMGNFYQKGDKIGQLIFFSPCIPELIFVDKFENKTTLRGEKGFGSTGR